MSVAPQETRLPFEREPSGLISLDQYKDYLIDKPGIVPIFMSNPPDNGRSRESHRFVYQHLLFQRESYWQTHLPLEERDRRYRAIRELSYSQIAMRSFMEQRLHSGKEEDVAYPPELTVDDALLDYFDLDMAAASALKIEDIKHPKNHIQRTSQKLPPIELQPLTDEDKVGIYEAKFNELLPQLEYPRVLAHDVVTSALMRLARLVRHNNLSNVARERLVDGYYYPLRVPKVGTLRKIGESLLHEAVGLKSQTEIQRENQGLQLSLNLVK